MYKCYTLDDLNSMLDYNPDTGVFVAKASGKELVDRSYYHRSGKNVTHLQLARVAIMMSTNQYMNPEDRVKYKDGDMYNLRLENLEVVDYKSIYKRAFNNPKNTYLATEEDHIFVGTMNNLFVVRRGKNQAIYRTYDKQEAIDVRDRWLESNKTLHELDDFMPKWYKKYIKQKELDNC